VARDYALATQSSNATMFAKRAKRSSQQQPPTDEGSQTAQSGPDPHAAVIERLERELEEQRTLATTLRESLDAATFKIEILEKSYAKQLTEARDKGAAVEAELQEKNEILANLGGGHEHTLRELNDALTVIKVLKTERDKLRKQIAEGGFRQPNDRQTKDRPTRAQLLVEDTSGETINALIANTNWAERKPDVGSGHAGAQVTKQEEPPHQEMIAPDLVFTEKDKEKEGER
jgi:chromosome segregation ATPase